MASIINAASSGSGGLVSTADSSGVLQLQTNGTTAMTVATSGYVGIGTTTPSTPLDIFNNTQTTTPAARFYINANGTTPSNLQGFAIYNNVSAGFVDATLVAGGGAYTYMAFGIHNGTSYSERARIDPSGNFGIGTSSPSGRIDVQNNQNATSNFYFRNTDTTNTSSRAALNVIGGNQTISLLAINADNAYLQRSVGNLQFQYAGSTQVTLDTSGNLGLGVTPSAWAASGPSGQVIQAPSYALSNDANTHYQSNNAYYKTATGWVYIASKYATQYQQNSASGTHSWYTAASGTAGNTISFTQAMTLNNSGYLGIGTTSPSDNLTVQGSVAFNLNSTTDVFKYYTGGAGLVYAGTTTSTSIGFITSGNERMRLDTSGNLGLGVTPSGSWGSNYRAIQVGYSTAFVGQNNDNNVYFTQNLYYDGTNFNAIKTGNVSYYQQYIGQHRWFGTATSYTGGTTASLSQFMTLGSDGTLGVGTTGAVATDGTFVAAGSNGTGQGAANTVAQANFWETTSGNKAGLWFGAMTNSNVGVIGSRTASGAIAFQTYNSGWAERARIDSSGNLLVGTTSSTTTPASGVQLNNGSSIGTVAVGHANGTATGNYFATFSYNAGLIGSITQSGTTAVLYNTTSDQRLKENIVDAPEFGSVIDSIQVRSYDWKADRTHQRAGFIAQELVTVAPEAVHQPADPEEMMAVDYSKLVPMLVKELQSLRARVAQLESQLKG